MKTRVFERLKPKAVSFGFNEDELRTAAECIAGSLAPEATDEMIDKAIDQFVPILGLSQNAAQRSFTRFKTQFEKDHPTPTTTPPTQPTPAEKTDDSKDKKEPDNEMPAWFKAYQSEKDKETKELKEQIERMSREKANEGYRSKALAALKDVDENYYELMLEGKEFGSEEEVNSFVTKVSDGWNKLVQAKNIQTQKEVTPPGGGAPAQDKPSQAILDRIAERGKIQETSPIKGIPTQK